MIRGMQNGYLGDYETDDTWLSWSKKIEPCRGHMLHGVVRLDKLYRATCVVVSGHVRQRQDLISSRGDGKVWTARSALGAMPRADRSWTTNEKCIQYRMTDKQASTPSRTKQRGRLSYRPNYFSIC